MQGKRRQKVRAFGGSCTAQIPRFKGFIMLSPVMDLKGISSSSHFSEDPSFPNERQVGFWKLETVPDKNGTAGGKFASSTGFNSKLISAGLPIITSLHHPEALMVQEQKVNLTLSIPDEHDKAANGTLASPKSVSLDQVSRYSLNVLPTAHFTKGNGVNMMGSWYENSLFSSSLSDLFSRKMKITSNSGLYGHSIDTIASHHEEEEQLESMDDIEAHMIGNLLPDDDELLAGVNNGLEFTMPSKGADDMEELDLFNSVGGMDLEEPIKHSGTDDGTNLGFHSSMQSPFLESAFHHGISSSVPNSLPSLMKVGSIGSHPGLTQLGHLKLENVHPHSLPGYHDALLNGIHCQSSNTVVSSINSQSMDSIDKTQLRRAGSNEHSLELSEGVFGSGRKGSYGLPGHYPWGCRSYQTQPGSMMWPHSPSFINGIHAAHSPSRLPGMSRTPSQLLNPVVGSAPAVNHSMWDCSQHFAGDSPKTSSFRHPASLGNMQVPNNSLHSMDFVPHMFPQLGGNSMDFPIGPKIVGLQPHHQRGMMFQGRGQMVPPPSSHKAPSERMRSRRSESGSNPVDNKKQYELDIDRIMRGEDSRTTLMIKNIPNKYTSKLLLAAIDERHRGTYDFIYLPIDFKNKCNVGYAFVNMTEPTHIIPFYKAFNGKKWEKFNSEKVASLAYARIQGKAALIAHFQNSSLMNEDKRCRPILFNTEGPTAGDQVPFPMGFNVRARPGKSRTSSTEDSNQGTQTGLSKGEDFSNRDTSVSCGKDSD